MKFCIWRIILLESRKLTSCEWAAFSHTLHKIGSTEIGLVFAGSSLSPDLRIGTISAFFHSSGKTSYDRSNNWWTIFQNFGMYFIATGSFVRRETRNNPLHIARSDGAKRKQGSNILTRAANAFTWMNSLSASNVEIVFFSKIRGFQSCNFSHIGIKFIEFICQEKWIFDSG